MWKIHLHTELRLFTSIHVESWRSSRGHCPVWTMLSYKDSVPGAHLGHLLSTQCLTQASECGEPIADRDLVHEEGTCQVTGQGIHRQGNRKSLQATITTRGGLYQSHQFLFYFIFLLMIVTFWAKKVEVNIKISKGFLETSKKMCQ